MKNENRSEKESRPGKFDSPENNRFEDLKTQSQSQTGNSHMTPFTSSEISDSEKNYKIKNSLKNSAINTINPIKCPHPNCNLVFKTEKLKILHHDNLNEECFDESNDLLKTLLKFVKFLKLQTYFRKYKLKEDEGFRSLWRSYEEFHKNYKNRELILSVIGDFEDVCK